MRFILLLVSLLWPLQIWARHPQYAQVGEYPYVVIVLYENRFRCSGALLTDRIYVLTAAHCVEHEKVSEFIVLAGAVDEVNVRDHHKYGVAEVIKHPRYRKETREFDLAILVLLRTVDKAEGAEIDLIPENYHIEKSKPVQMLYFDHSNGYRLTSVIAKMWPPYDCTALNIYGPYDFNMPYPLTTETTFCLGSPHTVCLNDDGGIAVAGNRLVGLASWNIDCNDPDIPLVLTNLAILGEWPERVIRNYYRVD